MNDIIKRVWWQDKTVTPDDLNGYIFTSESQAHTFVIEGKNKNTRMPVSINGTVTGEFVNADGVTVPLTGSANGVAMLTLTPECYFVPGRFKLTIYARNGSQNVCIYLGNGHCDKSSSDTVAYPSTAIPDLAQLMAQFNSRMDNIYSAFPTETVGPADVVTFDDGADDIPVKSLTVQMEPQQDLHGYDYSWVGGDGKNLWNPLWCIDRTANGVTSTVNDDVITFAGTPTTQNRWFGTGFITTLPVGTYTLTNISSGTHPLRLTSGSNANPTVATATANGSVTFTLSEETQISASITFSTEEVNTAVINETYKIQLEVGSTATDYEPYENICPITGYNAVNVTRAGSNLAKFVQDRGIDGNGAIQVVTGRIATEEPIIIRNGFSYKFTYFGDYSQGIYAVFNNDVLVRRVAGVAKDSILDTSGGDRFYFCGYTSNGLTIDSAKIMVVESNNNVTEYEPYHESETYTVSLSSAGTVYGGTLTVNGDGTGKVILDSIGHTFNGSENWVGQWYGTDYPIARLQQTYSPFAPYSDILSTANSNRISSHLRSASVTSTGLGYGVYLHTTGYINIRTACVVNATSNDDITVSIKAYLTEQAQKGTPLQVVVKILEESNYISFDLNTDQITTLLGGNTIWTDAGQVTVTYRADTEMYINKRLAEQ